MVSFDTGGHITDAWDRRTNNTYLAELMKPELRPEGEAKFGLELGPGLSLARSHNPRLRRATPNTSTRRCPRNRRPCLACIRMRRLVI